jgi:HEAT repeat protein
MEKVQLPKDLCRQILELDKTVRFAAVARLGNIMMSEYREGLDPLLSKRESEIYGVQTAITTDIRRTMEEKLGKIVYTVTLYEKIKRGTIPLSNDYLLMLSFDIHTDHESIILNKIIPLVKRHDLV